MRSFRIGVFDSGVGGLSVVAAIKLNMQDAQVVYVEDKKNIPYGSKTPEQLLPLVLPLLEDLQTKVDVIVIACNTVTTTLITKLREKLKVPLIGMEPMVKPAADLTKTGVFAVCATPTTLASERYKSLKKNFATGKTVIEPDCSDWSSMIESKKIDRQKIENQIEDVISKGADVIVLGCTHYHWIEEEIKQIANHQAQVLQPEKPVIQQLKKVLEQQL